VITSPAYRITRDGFVFLAMGFTGAKAAQWKEAFMAAFEALEAHAVHHAPPAFGGQGSTRLTPVLFRPPRALRGSDGRRRLRYVPTTYDSSLLVATIRGRRANSSRISQKTSA
jgi:hypothetical protein